MFELSVHGRRFLERLSFFAEIRIVGVRKPGRRNRVADPLRTVDRPAGGSRGRETHPSIPRVGRADGVRPVAVRRQRGAGTHTHGDTNCQSVSPTGKRLMT